MVGDDDHRSLGCEVLLAVDDHKSHPCGVAHDEIKAARGGPLGEAVFAHSSEGDRGEDAIGCTEDERGVRGEETGDESKDRECGKDQGHNEECHRDEDVGGDGEE